MTGTADDLESAEAPRERQKAVVSSVGSSGKAVHRKEHGATGAHGSGVVAHPVPSS